MADGIYVGMAAAAARAAQLDSISDNLVNAETPGFKASRPAFQSFLPGGRGSDKILSAAVATGHRHASRRHVSDGQPARRRAPARHVSGSA